MAEPKLYTTREAAKYLHMPITSFRRYVQDGVVIKHSTSRGGQNRSNMFTQEALDLFVEDRAQKAALANSSTEVSIADNMQEKVLEKFGVAALDRDYEPVVKWAAHDAPPKSPGVPILMISDVHYGEVVSTDETLHSNEFNTEICEQRLRRTFEKTVTLLKSHFVTPMYTGFVLVLGGDMISGSLHEDHMVTDEGTPIEQALGISEVISNGIAFLAQEFPNVTVYCVPGNHGRTTRKPRAKFYAQTNLDWLAYKMIQRWCDKDNVHVLCPPVRDLTFTVANHRYRLTHGDQFRGGDGIIGPIGPIMRGDTRKRFAANLMPTDSQEYDTILCGHFHQLMMLPRMIVNGSVKGYDEYALSINVPYELPQQALWTVHPKYGHTWQMPVLCDAN